MGRRFFRRARRDGQAILVLGRAVWLAAAGVVWSCAAPAHAQRSLSTATVASSTITVSTSATVNRSSVSTSTSSSVSQSTMTASTAAAPVAISSGTLEADYLRVDISSKTGYAKGNVVVRQSSGTLTGDSAVYNWQVSSGSVDNAWGTNPPWSFGADRLRVVSRGVYEGEDIELTSCDEVPPHYRIRASHGKIRAGKRATLSQARFVGDETPLFWMPFYTRSLVPKKYTLRLEPGSNSRDGLTNRTIFGYPFTPNTRTKLLWDWRERTGNGFGVDHQYYRPDIKGSLDTYYIKDVNPDPTPSQEKYNILWNHYQRFTSRLTGNARFELKNPQEFGNEFNRVGSQILVENPVRGILSEAGFNYQFSKSALQVQADRQDKFDNTVSSKQFISKLTLPRVTYNTVPLKFKHVPFYTNFTANYLNETVSRTSPQQTLRYQRSGSVGTRVLRDFRIKRKWTITPSAGFDEAWQDRDFASTTSEKDVYVGRPNGALTVRRRLGRSADATLSYGAAARFRINSTKIDTGADDYGVEREQLSSSLTSWVGRSSRLTLSGGYDFRTAPRSAPSRYRHSSARWTPPSVDVQWTVNPRVNLFFRETYSIFDASTNNVRRTPLNTSGEIQLGDPTALTFFSQGFTYTKPQPGQTSDLILTNKLKFFLTPKWYVDFFLSYRAIANQKLDYRKAKPIERTVRIVRDLHCWIFRMEFSSRPGRTDASFYIDLKVNGMGEKDVFRDPNNTFSGPSRDQGTDPFSIFPSAEPNETPANP